MSNKIILLVAVAGISLATSASALPLSPLPSYISIVEARTVCHMDGHCWNDAYPGRAIPPGVPRLYRHEGRSKAPRHLYDPIERRHY